MKSVIQPQTRAAVWPAEYSRGEVTNHRAAHRAGSPQTGSSTQKPRKPSETLAPRWFNAGPTSQTPAQHWTSVGPASRVFLERCPRSPQPSVPASDSLTFVRNNFPGASPSMAAHFSRSHAKSSCTAHLDTAVNFPDAYKILPLY